MQQEEVPSGMWRGQLSPELMAGPAPISLFPGARSADQSLQKLGAEAVSGVEA